MSNFGQQTNRDIFLTRRVAYRSLDAHKDGALQWISILS